MITLDTFGKSGYYKNVFCRHTTTPVKLLNVDCRDMPDANHILRCKYDISQTGSDCSAALAINCGEWLHNQLLLLSVL